MKNLLTLQIKIPKLKRNIRIGTVERFMPYVVGVILSTISILSFIHYLNNGLGLSYNDARSHLDIGRRVVEGLKPGLAQLGSVWLPLPHLLMVPTIWNDYFWHTGLAGALQSMISFVATGLIIYHFLKILGAKLPGRILGIAIFVININILYLQSIAMTELLLMATMTAGVYELVKWMRDDEILPLIRASGWIMLSTLVRYDGWFLLAFSAAIVFLYTVWKKGYKTAEGIFILFCTLGGFGIFLWLLWNQLIFKDALYFAFGPFSAHSQQAQLEEAGVLQTKGDILLSLKIYLYGLIYNSGAFTSVLALAGAVFMWFDKKLKTPIKIGSLALLAPFLFNVIALYLGHSVLFIQGISGNTWFNVRYGSMMMPSIAIYVGYLLYRLKTYRWGVVWLLAFSLFFFVANNDAVTIDDARVGSSQKNVTEVSGYLKENASNEKGFILISAASHDAIIFSSGLPMKRFIHEGTGAYWESGTTTPDHWARWIVMRTHDDNDLTYKLVSKAPGFDNYELVASYPFADVYELQEEFRERLNTEPILGKQR